MNRSGLATDRPRLESALERFKERAYVAVCHVRNRPAHPAAPPLVSVPGPTRVRHRKRGFDMSGTRSSPRGQDRRAWPRHSAHPHERRLDRPMPHREAPRAEHTVVRRRLRCCRDEFLHLVDVRAVDPAPDHSRRGTPLRAVAAREHRHAHLREPDGAAACGISSSARSWRWRAPRRRGRPARPRASPGIDSGASGTAAADRTHRQSPAPGVPRWPARGRSRA